jgi:hypothetical protein
MTITTMPPSRLALADAGVVLADGDGAGSATSEAVATALGASETDDSGVEVASEAVSSGADCVACAVAGAVANGLAVAGLAVVGAGAVVAGAAATLVGGATPGATYPSDRAW